MLWKGHEYRIAKKPVESEKIYHFYIRIVNIIIATSTYVCTCAHTGRS